MYRSTISVLLSAPSLTAILMLIVMCATPASAQTIHDIRQNFFGM